MQEDIQTEGGQCMRVRDSKWTDSVEGLETVSGQCRRIRDSRCNLQED